MGRPAPPNFTALYKVYEIIEHAGGMNAAMKLAGVPRSRTRLFTRTANHPKASGDAARHARSNEQPPTNPMSLDEARAMIRTLGPGRTTGASVHSSAADSHPDIGTSDQSLPGPATNELRTGLPTAS